MKGTHLPVDEDHQKTGLLDSFKGARRLAPFVVILVVVLGSLYIRLVLRTGVTLDYTDFFLPWYEELASKGLSAFSGNFANYNFPYLFLLYVTTFLPVTSLSAVKLIAVAGDLFLAFSVFRLMAAIRPNGWSKWIATASVLAAPSVFVVSAYWGQVDSLYCGFLFLALSAIVRGRYNLMWLWWGIAFAFKLQAIFFLPLMLVVVLAKHFRWYQPLIAVGAFAALSIPPAFFGRSLSDTFSVYVGQTGGQWRASYWSASVYEWVPDVLAPFVGTAGTTFAFLVVFAASVFVALRVRLDNMTIVYVAFLSMAIVPLLLPYMHDRYFFGATAFAIVIAILKPDLAWIAVLLQAMSLWLYVPFIAGEEPVPLVIAPAVLIVIFFVVCRRLPGIGSQSGPDGDLRPHREVFHS